MISLALTQEKVLVSSSLDEHPCQRPGVATQQDGYESDSSEYATDSDDEGPPPLQSDSDDDGPPPLEVHHSTVDSSSDESSVDCDLPLTNQWLAHLQTMGPTLAANIRLDSGSAVDELERRMTTLDVFNAYVTHTPDLDDILAQ